MSRRPGPSPAVSLIAIFFAWAAAPACSVWIDGDRFQGEDDPGAGGGVADATPGAGAEVDGSVDPGPLPEADAAPPDARPGSGQPDAAPAECTGSCEEGCDDGCCRETCDDGPGGPGGPDGPDCELACDLEDCSCDLDCGASDGTCNARCTGASCSIDCRDVSRCHARCERESDCTVDCTGAGRCNETECTAGASCLLDCGSGDCRFKKCDGEERSCPGGIAVCNRDCP